MAIFIYNKEASDPEFDQYGIYDCRDQKIYYCTAEELINYQNEGYVIDGLPKEVRVVKKTENLHKAKKAKNDEFYTQLSDIEKELMNYDPALFKDKVIYCPTDVAFAQGRILPSEFVHYFQLNARRLGFKKLIATCLAEKVDNSEKVYNRYEFTRELRPDCDPSIPSYNPYQQKYFSEDLPDEVYYEDEEGKILLDENSPQIDTVHDAIKKQMLENKRDYDYEREKKRRMEESGETYNSKYIIRVKLSECEPDADGSYGSGDFRSKECTEILKKSDIVVTNPPFSLFREFMAWLLRYDKKFLVIGNENGAQYKELFPLIKDGKIWLGVNHASRFVCPEETGANNTHVEEDGTIIAEFGNICWFTNLRHNRKADKILLTENYYEEDGVTPLFDAEDRYPHYDNYDAINVDRVKKIPCDYYGDMGVPITFIEKFNPDQFILVGADFDVSSPITLDNGKIGRDRFYINQKRMYTRVVIRRKQPEAQSE